MDTVLPNLAKLRIDRLDPRDITSRTEILASARTCVPGVPAVGATPPIDKPDEIRAKLLRLKEDPNFIKFKREHADPIRLKLRMDKLEPKQLDDRIDRHLEPPITTSADPGPVPAIEQLDASLAKPLKDNELPKFKKSKIDTAEPTREKLRIDTEEPSCNKSQTDTVVDNLTAASPLIDIPELNRVKLRIDNVDPICKKFKRLTLDPQRTKLRTDNDDPK